MPKPHQATQYAKGAIIGSAFIKDLTEKGTGHISEFCERNSN
jgi:tryptophan synthase alpha chain